MNKLYYSLLIALFATISSAFANQDFTLKLKNGEFTPTPLNQSTQLSGVSNLFNQGYAIVQFSEIPTEAQKSILQQNGLRLLEYLPEMAYLTYSENLSQASLGSLNIRSITPYENSFKIAPRLYVRENPDWAMQGSNLVDLTMALQLNTSADELATEFEQLGAEILKISYYKDFLNIRISLDKIDDLSNQWFVKYLDYVPAPPEKEDTRARSLHRGNLLDADHALGRKYDGTGVSMALADDGNIGPHIDFKGRVTQFTTTDRGTHGDMCSGIAVGAGNLNPVYRGMATGAYLYYYDIGGYPHIGGAVNNYNTNRVVVTSTSYSQGCNSYENTARAIDQQVRQNPQLLHVFSAGNSASSNCGYGAGTPWGNITGGRKQGKSVIATGNLDYQAILTNSSSRGPSEDGRIKPDICANGTNQISTDPNNAYSPGGGTSAAAPGIAGLAVQLYHGYRDLNGGADPESGLIKAALLNTAHDLGNKGPDFFYGWGRVNAHRAMSLLEDNRYLADTLAQNVTKSHTFTIPSGTEQLRAMVYWTDFEGSTVASKALVNDLDMRLVTPNGDTIRPWTLNPSPNPAALSSPATRGIDDLNNMEQVTIDTVPAGSYTVLVNGRLVPQGPQKYFLLWEIYSDSIEVTYPAGGEAFVPNELETIRWDAVEGTGSFTVSYSTNNGQTWTSIATVNSARRYLNWRVPNVTSGDMLVRVTRSSVSGQSNRNFSIMNQVNNFAVDFICPDSIKFRWSPVNGATDYVIYQLGATHMDSIGITSNLNYTVYNLNLSDENWFSIKAVGNGIESRRINAVEMPNQPLNCPLPYDMNVTQINTPNIDFVPSCNVSKAAVRITINNAGDSVLTNVPMLLYVNNTVYNDTIPGPIASGAFQFFTFRDSVTLTAGAKNISTVAKLANDNNPLNDSVSTVVNIYNGTAFSPPYSFDFETLFNCSTNSNCGATTCNLNNGWINLPNNLIDDHDMRVNSGTTPSTGTGPSFDHNPGTAAGKYIYAEASGGCTGEESQVVSPCFDLSNTVRPEFSFWYHMDGTQMGVIRVDILRNGTWTNNIITPIFGNQGTAWQQQTINLGNYVGEIVNIRFRVTTGTGFRSDIAIDDVSLIDQATGISEVKRFDELIIYPNPSSGIFQIKSAESINTQARVFDLNGRVVKQFRLEGSFNTLDLSQLEKGVYFLDLDGINRREKLIIY